jgi:hypothetical protein
MEDEAGGRVWVDVDTAAIDDARKEIERQQGGTFPRKKVFDICREAIEAIASSKWDKGSRGRVRVTTRDLNPMLYEG